MYHLRCLPNISTRFAAIIIALGAMGMLLSCVHAADQPQRLPIDETPADASEWGFRPADGAIVNETPPSFVWRPQQRALTYTVQVAADASFDEPVYEADKLHYNAHRPATTFEPGQWYWRFRFVTPAGQSSAWSQPRGFTIADDAAAQPLPSRETLLARIPDEHPRLFMRPE